MSIPVVLVVIIASALAAPFEDTDFERIKKSPAFDKHSSAHSLRAASQTAETNRFHEDGLNEKARSYYASPGAGVSSDDFAAGAVSGAGMSGAGLSGAGMSGAGMSGAGMSGSGMFGGGMSGGGASGSAVSSNLLFDGMAGAASGHSSGILGGEPTVGYFPNVKQSLGVPILLSCSPSVISGHLAEHQSSDHGATSGQYSSGSGLSSGQISSGHLFDHQISNHLSGHQQAGQGFAQNIHGGYPAYRSHDFDGQTMQRWEAGMV